jgi:hypothetical protein
MNLWLFASNSIDRRLLYAIANDRIHSLVARVFNLISIDSLRKKTRATV